MKAVILAAGVGKRLREVSGNRPKCLIEIGGRSLLSRHLENLASCGVLEIMIVVGYQEHRIRQAVEKEDFAGRVQYVVNDAYERGSIGSLWAALHDLQPEDILIMDADVLYHPAIMHRLVESSCPNALLMDETVSQESEECMVVVRGERVVALTKQVKGPYDIIGEGVGFLKVQKSDVPNLLQSVRSYIEAGFLDMEYEDALKEFFQSAVVGYDKIGGLPWIEIDFPEDIRRADGQIFPLFEQHESSMPSQSEQVRVH